MLHAFRADPRFLSPRVPAHIPAATTPPRVRLPVGPLPQLKELGSSLHEPLTDKGGVSRARPAAAQFSDPLTNHSADPTRPAIDPATDPANYPSGGRSFNDRPIDSPEGSPSDVPADLLASPLATPLPRPLTSSTADSVASIASSTPSTTPSTGPMASLASLLASPATGPGSATGPIAHSSIDPTTEPPRRWTVPATGPVADSAPGSASRFAVRPAADPTTAADPATMSELDAAFAAAVTAFSAPTFPFPAAAPTAPPAPAETAFAATGTSAATGFLSGPSAAAPAGPPAFPNPMPRHNTASPVTGPMAGAQIACQTAGTMPPPSTVHIYPPTHQQADYPLRSVESAPPRQPAEALPATHQQMPPPPSANRPIRPRTRPQTPPPFPVQRESSKAYLRTPERTYILSYAGLMSQEKIRRELQRRGISVSQATISRVIRSGRFRHRKPPGRTRSYSKDEEDNIVAVMKALWPQPGLTLQNAPARLFGGRMSSTTLQRILKRRKVHLCTDKCLCR